MKMEHPVNRLNRIQKEIKNPIGNWGVGYIAELMQKYAEEYHQSKVNNVVLDGVKGMCCEKPKHATEVNDMFESWVYCKNCNKDIV